MNILHISDTHGRHAELTKLPKADVIVHSGDFTFGGSEKETMDFLNWFLDLSYRHKILVAGNHDDCLYGSLLEGLDNNCHYLCNSDIVIEGVRFYGVPMFMQDCVSGQQEKNISNIPTGIDVLITHQPPYGILDRSNTINYGSFELLTKVEAIAPQFHLFGHIHASNGEVSIGTTKFVNSAIISENYQSIQSNHILSIRVPVYNFIPSVHP